METSRSSGPPAGGPWAIRRATEDPQAEEDVRGRLEQLRQEVSAHRADAVEWEASLLDHLASLLDSMDHARLGWESMAAELSDAQRNLRAAGRERTKLDEAEAQLGQVREELAIATHEREELEEANRRLREAVGEVEALRRERDAAREACERERAAHGERDAALGREIETLRDRLDTARRERDLLAEERDARENLRAELAAARERIAALEKEAEKDLVLVCDLRARVVRLEEERDDEARKGRQRVKRILARIHEELDRIGAPKGDELSFGERLRRLRES
jgi:chromosome segregation ATPase